MSMRNRLRRAINAIIRSASSGGTPESPYKTSTIWRMHITDNEADWSNTTVVDVKFYDSEDVLIDNTAGTKTSSSNFNGSFTAPNAFDGNTGTRWATANGQPYPSWIQIEFPVAITPHSFSVRGFGDSASDAKDFTMQYWDGSAFQVLKTITNQTNWANVLLRTFELYE